MDARFLLFVIIAIIGAGIVAGGADLSQSLNDRSVQDDYVTLDGPCEIRVYDDPLYAEHWAKNVNNFNCASYAIQEQAEYTEAQTEDMNWGTLRSKIATGGVGGTLLLILAVLAFWALKG